MIYKKKKRLHHYCAQTNQNTIVLFKEMDDSNLEITVCHNLFLEIQKLQRYHCSERNSEVSLHPQL